jgi:hypothetical protein
MAATVVKQFVDKINSGETINFFMTNANPPFNRRLSEKAQPEVLIEWQAVPLVLSFDVGMPVNPTAKPGLMISPVTVIQENDTSLTHKVPITCIDVGNPPGSPARFVTTFVLYAVFFDVPK